MADNTVNINTQNDTVIVEKDASVNSVSVTNSNTTVNVTAPSNTVTLDGATSVNTVTINTQSDITKLLSITEPKGDTVTVTKPESKVVTVTTPGPPGPPLASATETDSLVSFDRDIATDKIYAADGLYHKDDDDDTHISFPTGDKIYATAGGVNFIYAWQKDADVNKLIFNENNTDTDIVFRSANGSNNKLLYLDASTDRVGIGTGTPTEKLTVEGNVDITGSITITENLYVDQHIMHKDDNNTYINFSDDRIRFNAGGLNLFGMHKKGSAPHQVTVNNGSNNVDFVVKDNSNNKLIQTDASARGIIIDGSKVDFTNLPTTDPGVAGRLWNDSNTLKISAG